MHLLLLLLAYIAGATPFGLIVAWLVGRIDIRQHGSRNIGATNVGRVLGNKWGAFVLVLDLMKGYLPVLLLPPLFLAPDAVEHWRVATGLATIVGHIFPFWLGFRGGKGVATAAGVVLCLAPIATVAALVTFLLSFAIWRTVSLSSVLAVTGFAIVQLALSLPAPFDSRHWPLSVFAILAPALIIVRHRSNLVRLARGEEPRYEFRKQHSEQPEPGPSDKAA